MLYSGTLLLQIQYLIVLTKSVLIWDLESPSSGVERLKQEHCEQYFELDNSITTTMIYITRFGLS